MDASEANQFVDEGLKDAGLPDTTGVPMATQEEVAASSLGAETTSPVLPSEPPAQPVITPPVATVAEPPKTAAAQVETHTDVLGLGTGEAEQAQAEPVMVPVGVVADLREKNRQLKARVGQLEQVANAPPAETGEDLDKIDQVLSQKQPDDLLTVAEGQTIINAVKLHTAKIAQSATGRIEQGERAAFRKAVLGAEATARTSHTDYDATMNTAKTLGGFSRAEIVSAYKSDNPMEYLYGVAQGKIATVRQTLGIPAPTTPQAPQKPTPPGQPPPAGTEKAPTDDDIFESAFGEQPAPKTG